LASALPVVVAEAVLFRWSARIYVATRRLPAQESFQGISGM
jgi:hypothetical protein